MQQAISTSESLRANLAAGGERERQARHALALASTYHSYCELGRDLSSEQALAHYNRYCEHIGYDPLTDVPRV